MAFIDGIFDDSLKSVHSLQENEHAYKASVAVTDRDLWVKKLKAEYKKHAHSSLPKELEDLVFELPNYRLNSHTNRSYFVKLVAEHIIKEHAKHLNWEEQEPLVVKLALCSEMMITVQYYHNYIFDGKNGVNTPLMIRETLIKANLLKSWLFRYIEQAQFPPVHSKLVAENIDNAFNQTDIGQFIEGRYNTYEYYQRKELKNDYIDYYLFQNKEVDWEVINDCIAIATKGLALENYQQLFIKLYFLRLYLISTALYQTFVQILIKAYAPELSEKRLMKFSAYYGIMMQIVNDNIDFVPGYMGQDTKPKFAQDQQCDIKNKNLTLPLFVFLHLKGAKKTNILQALNLERNKGYSERREKQVFDDILPVLINHTIPIGQLIAQRALNFATNNPKLAELTSIADKNRFYKEIFDA